MKQIHIASLALAAFAVVGAGTVAQALSFEAPALQDRRPPRPDVPQSDAPQADKKDEKVVLPKVADGAKAELGKLAADFALKDLDGKDVMLSAHLGKIVVLEWLNPGCPYCVQAYGENGALREQPDRVKKEGVVWLTINSTEPGQDGGKVEVNKEFAQKNGIKSTIAMDPDGAVGRAYGAKTTPHCYVINEKGVLVYAGALDNAPMGKVEGDQKKVNYVDAAIADIKAGRAVATSETKPYGCSVKYAKQQKREEKKDEKKGAN